VDEDEVVRREMQRPLGLFASTRQGDLVYLHDHVSGLELAVQTLQVHALAIRVRSMAITQVVVLTVVVGETWTQALMSLTWHK